MNPVNAKDTVPINSKMKVSDHKVTIMRDESKGIAVFTTPPAPAEKKGMIPPTPNNIGAQILSYPPHCRNKVKHMHS